MMNQFSDRREAGRALGHELGRFSGEDPVVLALPRGGVAVAFEVAHFLKAPFEIFIVQKIGVPGCGELAMGAVASGGIQVLDGDLIRRLHVAHRAVDTAIDEGLRKLASREEQYGAGSAPPVLRGRTVILVDEGLAAGITMRAAVQAVRSLAPARVVVAAPVGGRNAIALLECVADEVVCLRVPEPCGAIGQWYTRFGPISDYEVRELLGRSRLQERLAS
jgi:predicted phosphoribosyltransferase